MIASKRAKTVTDKVALFILHPYQLPLLACRIETQWWLAVTEHIHNLLRASTTLMRFFAYRSMQVCTMNQSVLLLCTISYIANAFSHPLLQEGHADA